VQKHNTYSELLAKKLSGNATADELRDLDNWRKEQVDNEDFARNAEELWQMSDKYSDHPFVTDKKAAWQAIESKLDTQGKVVQMRPWRRVLQIAAMSVFVIGAYWLWNNSANNTAAEFMAFHTYENENKEIELPDGSKIWLNENSSVRYAADFQKRNVTLKGEAFFEVARMEDSPFKISSGGATTRVLGTSFNIRAYPKEAQVELTVKTGKVAFSDKNKEETKILIAGEAANYVKAAKKIVESPVLETNALAWQTKKLAFISTPFSQVEKDLERYYGVEIEVKNSALSNCRFEGGIFNKAELSEILELLQITMEWEVSQEGAKYIIEGEGCE
jgi:transmembrane sensor